MTVEEHVQRLASLAERRSFQELLEEISNRIRKDPALRHTLLDALDREPNSSLQSASRQMREMVVAEDNLITDVVLARERTPLKPGTRIRLLGGYTAVYGEACYGGESFWLASVIDLVERSPGRPPLLWAELDERKVVGEVSGKFVLLKLRYVANWEATETVSVSLLDQLPENLSKFYPPSPDSPKEEIETHGSYRIEESRE